MERYANPKIRQEVQIVEDKLEKELLLTTSCVITNKSTKDWIIDSGCTNYMIHDRELFKELNKSNICTVRIGNGERVVEGIRTISIKIHSGIKLIFYVLYVSEITQNLSSVAQMFENKVCVIKDANNLKTFKVHLKDKRFVLDLMKE